MDVTVLNFVHSAVNELIWLILHVINHL